MPAAFQNKFVEIIKHYRRRNGHTQQSIADMLNISLRTYQRLELGESYPSVDVLINISNILGFSVKEVFKYNEEASRDLRVLDTVSELLVEASRISSVGAWELDLENNDLYWTQVTRDIHEVPDDFTPTLKNAVSFYNKEDGSNEKISRSVDEAKRFGRDFSVSATIFTYRGKKLNVLAKGRPIYIAGKCRKLIGTFQDVSEYISKSQYLSNMLGEANFLFEMAGIGKWELDLVNNRLKWSKSLYSIFEIDEEKFGETYDAFLNMIHPEDRKLVDDAYMESLIFKKAYEVEHRLLMKDGRVKWIQEKCKTDFNPDGRPIRSVGYALDITKYRSNNEVAKINWL